MKKEHVQLTQSDRNELETLIRKGKLKVRKYRRALGLLELDRGKTYTMVSETLGVTIPKLSLWATQYPERGLMMLEEKARPGDPSRSLATNEPKSQPWHAVNHPKDMLVGICGYWPIRWSNWAIVNRYPTRRWLKYSKNELKPHLKRTWCIGKLDSRFLAWMEQILMLYALPYDPAYPVVCYDEQPCFLIGDRIEPVAMQTGQLRKERYAYEKNG